MSAFGRVRAIEERSVVDFGAVHHDVRVRLQVLLSGVAEPRRGLGRRDAAQVPERGASVTQVVWREHRDAGRLARPCERGAETVGAEALKNLCPGGEGHGGDVADPRRVP
jgi:hypothetical protein